MVELHRIPNLTPIAPRVPGVVVITMARIGISANLPFVLPGKFQFSTEVAPSTSKAKYG